ncbi:MAG: hypothetical protein HBSAPP03_17650 [Phycisphaerae bacterium]|nr:MAG: hypothetical protein HBSAPP03_17650 [Phycisphaerae bacterium]
MKVHHFAGALLAASLLFSALAPAQLAPGQRHTTPSSAEQLSKDTETLRHHLTTLADPFFEGRAPGTRGNRLAADYIEFHLRQLGLTPAFPEATTTAEGATSTVPNASFRQPFQPMSARPPYGKAETPVRVAEYSIGEAATSLTPGRDFTILGYSGSGEVTAPLAFAGYSINEGQDDYSTYVKRDSLKGKIAIVLRFEPMDKDGKSLWAGSRWSPAAGLDPKLRAAVDAGAVGIIFVNAPGADDDRAREDRLAGLELAGSTLKVPIVMMSQKAADALVRAAHPDGRSLLDLRRGADEKGGVIDLPNAVVTLKTSIQRPSTLTDNVGAVLPGKGALADQWIIIGSHYDHVGYGPVGAREQYYGQIHAGADDNASGSSGNLLVARKLAEAYRGEHAPENTRSILFLWFSAEESGLEGARHFANHPTMPLKSVSLMLNMDMIGRLRDGRFEVGGIGTANGLEEWSQPYWDSFGMPVKATRMGAPNSDHYAFHLKEVPNLFVFTGLHREYHTPADTVDTINAEGAARVADLVYRVALDAASRPDPFKFASATQLTDEDDEPAPAPRQVGGLKVRFGIMPGDYAGDDGVMVGDLSGPELPAAKAGLKAGDRITRWGGQPVTTVEAWMALMMKNNPGDEVEIVYVRDGVEHTTKATLIASGGARPRQ